MDILSFLKDIGFAELLDIMIMSVLIYAIIVGIKRTRAAFVLTGILIMAFAYLITRQFNLALTASVFEKFFAIILIILVVIFQEELKHFFEEIAIWSFNRGMLTQKRKIMSRKEVDILSRTLVDLARDKIGALIVLRRKSILERHLDGEIDLNGELSEPILKSIFDPNSAGHDGAVIIEGARITHFAAHLPLSKNLAKIKDKGTRHAAALGLSEVTDALCLVVSEEKGTISIAQNGEMQTIKDIDKLSQVLDEFYEQIKPSKKLKPWEDFIKRNTKEKIYAFLLALGLWFVLVHGATITQKTYTIPAVFNQPPEGLIIKNISPPGIRTTFKGPRTAFYFNAKNHLRLNVLFNSAEQKQIINISEDDFLYPKNFTLENYEPKGIVVTLQPKAVQQ